jgi:hypothetical protein
MNFGFNLDSTDSKLAEILARLCAQDEVLKSILEQALRTNGRISSLEGFPGDHVRPRGARDVGSRSGGYPRGNQAHFVVG